MIRQRSCWAIVGPRQEHHADGEPAGQRFVAGVADMLLEKFLRDLHMNAGPVAGLAVGIHRAAMPEGGQRLDAELDDFAACLAVDRDNQPDAARIVLVGRIIGARGDKFVGVGPPIGDKLLACFRALISFTP